METRANFVVIGAFTLAAVMAGLPVPHVDRRLRDVGSPQALPDRLQRLGLRAFQRRPRALQRPQGRRGDEAELRRTQPEPGRRRHRCDQRERADQREHQGAARDAGPDGLGHGRADRRRAGRGGAGRRGRPSARHSFAAHGDARGPADEGRLRARSRQQAAGRQRPADPPDDRERASPSRWRSPTTPTASTRR